MCRMCLVDVGRPERDRQTGEIVLNQDGSPKINFGWKLETACTVPVSDGMVVQGMTEKVEKARQDILEFLLTSHPLDCPICDKGGECPLQNLTMGHGPGESRFLYDDKIHLDKRVPLGDLIFLDRERCIQCARCTRFQSEIVDDPVIGFYQRGRSLEIVTFSEPGFDSYWSGNTSDICPVGALTTADFRFGARPWELNEAASICSHCPVGCNLTLNTRREAKSDGDFVIKRVMPRQNEWVNELWICDKGRFAHHFTESRKRLTHPMVRKNGSLEEVAWDEALDLVASRLREAGEDTFTLVSGRLSNEDLFNLYKLSEGLGAKTALHSYMGGGDLIPVVGVGQGTNIADIGENDAILVVASDLEEEAPVWWLRVKQAAERGATLIVANPRPTKIDRHANHILRYTYGQESATIQALIDGDDKAAEAFTGAENAIVFYGSEGIGFEESQTLSRSCANLLAKTDHIGKPNNGLIGVWSRANELGAWDMGFRPRSNLKEEFESAKVLYIAGADPFGDDPATHPSHKLPFIVVQELFLTETAQAADVVLPAQAVTECEGSFTSGERRVQRFYPAARVKGQSWPNYSIAAQLAQRLGLMLEERSASLVMDQIAAEIPSYQGVNYQNLALVSEQWPIVGREDLYYGGTSYANHQGMGVQLPISPDGASFDLPIESISHPLGEVVAVPITRLYDHGTMLTPSDLLRSRTPEAYICLNPIDAEYLRASHGMSIQIKINETTAKVDIQVDEHVPAGYVLIPRSMGVPIERISAIKILIGEAVQT
ncbi:MAG: molybdopterin-dependent oxidoreductase, partial [Anaerolineales bacterium]